MPPTEARRLDARAARLIDGWIDIYDEGDDIRGRPPIGLRRAVKNYSRDAGRAMHLARKAVDRTGGQILVTICRDEIKVETRTPMDEVAYSATLDRTALFSHAITSAAVALVEAKTGEPIEVR